MARILLAEDKQDVGALMEEILRYEGHETVLKVNGEEAINTLKEDKNFDLLITDLIMPIMDGFDLVNFLKSEKIDIPVIAVSGGGVTLSSDNALKAIERDVDIILQKPVNIQKIKSAIDKLLDK